MQYAEVRQNKFQLIFVVVGIALVIIVLGIAGSLLNAIDTRLQEDAERQVTELTQQAASSVADHIRLTEQTLDSFTLQSVELNDIQPALKSLQDNFGFNEVAFVGEDGESCRADGSPYVCKSEEPVEFTAESGQLSYTAPYKSEDGSYIYHAIKTLYVDGKAVGELHINVPIEIIIGSKQFNLFGGEGFFVLFDAKSGLVTVGATSARFSALQEGSSLYGFLNDAQRGAAESELFSSVFDAQNHNYVAQLQQAVSKGETNLFIGTIGDEQNYVCVAPIGVSNAYVCSIIPENSVRSEAEAVTTVFEIVFGIILVSLLATLVMSFFFYRKRMEKKGVEMKTHLYGALSDSLDMAVNMYSPDDGVVTPIVAKAREVIGYPMAEFMSNKRIADKANLSKEGRDILNRIRTGYVVSLEQGTFSLKDRKSGDLRWIFYSVTPFYYEDKRQLLVVFQDSTTEKNLQLSMKDAMIAAETANRTKSDFLSRMSHEIRTPMNAIIGMTQIAKNHLDDQKKVESSLEKITGASDHLLSLINDVLDISKIESGKISLSSEEFSFTELLENVKAVISAQAAQKEQSFEVEVSSIVEDCLVGDKTRIQQLLINLLSNSVKYTPKNGRIKFEVNQTPSVVPRYVQVSFVVSDNGIGMSEEYQKHIFEPFVMEGRSIAQGTGLGMPIVKNILTMLNGGIQVESEIDKGTTFTVSVNLERSLENTRLRKGEDRVLVSGEDLFSEEGFESVNTTDTHEKPHGSVPISIHDFADKEENLSSKAASEINSFIAGLSNRSKEKWQAISREKNLSNGESPDIDKSKENLSSGAALEHGKEKESSPAALESADNAGGESVEHKSSLEKLIEGVDFSNMRVLLVEDNDLNAEIAKELLMDAGLVVEWARNGQEACDMFESSKGGFYDIIFMDIQMPVMNGYEATKRIRKFSHPDAKSIPIVAMSANAFTEDVQASLRVGMNDHLSKPIDIRLVLASIMEQVLGKK